MASVLSRGISVPSLTCVLLLGAKERKNLMASMGCTPFAHAHLCFTALDLGTESCLGDFLRKPS